MCIRTLLQRPAFKIDESNPGSDLAGETAAALAAGYLVFKETDKAFAELCLSHARDMFQFAVEYPGKYSDAIPGVSDFYKSWSGYEDEIVWAATWLYRATGSEEYKTKVSEGYSGNLQSMFSWDNKIAGYQVHMAQITGEEPYLSHAQTYADFMTKSATKTPKGKNNS